MNIAGIQAVRWPSPKLGHFLWQAVDDSSVGTWINTSKQYMGSDSIYAGGDPGVYQQGLGIGQWPFSIEDGTLD
jgi:hypothetical protein